MEWFWIFMIAVVVLAINGAVASKFADIAGMKGHEGSPYFWFTFFMGIVGMLMVVALPDLNRPKTDIRTPSPSNPKPGSWTCTCGRKHQSYETSCIGGVTKASLKKTSNN